MGRTGIQNKRQGEGREAKEWGQGREGKGRGEEDHLDLLPSEKFPSYATVTRSEKDDRQLCPGRAWRTPEQRSSNRLSV